MIENSNNTMNTGVAHLLIPDDVSNYLLATSGKMVGPTLEIEELRYSMLLICNGFRPVGTVEMNREDDGTYVTRVVFEKRSKNW